MRHISEILLHYPFSSTSSTGLPAMQVCSVVSEKLIQKPEIPKPETKQKKEKETAEMELT